MHIGQVLNSVFDEEVGWRPASGNVKPVHVANGLVRALCGRYHDTVLLNRFIIWTARGGQVDEERSFKALVERGDTEGVFAAFADAPDEFERARRYANGLLNNDTGVYPSVDQSAFTLTCAQMASRSPNDRGLGDFGAAILNGGSAMALADELRKALQIDRPQDPISAAVWPLLEMEGREAKHSERAVKALKRKHNQQILAQMKEAAGTLATHERAQGNRLRTLQRGVHFVCVAPQVHAQALASDGDLGKRPPALLALAGGRGSPVAIASERSVDLIYQSFQRWLGKQLAARLDAGRPLVEKEEPLKITSADGRAIRAVLQQIGGAEKAEQSEPASKELLDARMADYADARRRFGDKASLALGHALVAAYSREFESGGPREFLQGLSRKTGLLFPHFQGRAREKRVRPSVPILDMIVRACVDAGDLMPMDKFLERLWMRFGLIVGTRQTGDWSDSEYLAGHGVGLDPSALVENGEAFVMQLEQIGLARRYADNVTYVGDAHGK